MSFYEWSLINSFSFKKGEKMLSWSLYSSWLECRKLHACTHRPRPSPRPILPRTHAHTCTAKGWATAHVIQLISCSGTCASFADSGPLYNLKGKNTHGMFCRTFKEYFAGCCDELHFPYNLFLNRYLTVTSTSTWNRTTPCVKLTLEVRHNPTVYTLLGG